MATTLSDLTASDQWLPLRVSVSLVLTVLGPPSAHGCYHDAVHVEPGLTQRRRVGLAQTALQHVEKGLTHHLKKSKTNQNTNTHKAHIIHCALSCEINSLRAVQWKVDHTANASVLTPTAWCFLPRLSRKSSKEWRSSRWLTAASITSITWDHVITHTHNHRGCSRPCTSTNCNLVVVGAANRAHLGDMFQELRAGEAVLCGATVCTVVEKTEERRVQLKQSTTDKYHTVL